ncbi:MAG TPA: hypothetical protein VMG38_12315 [Trebonia sp.]|nr:hypothetical protein [Trebonia sp.]
MESPNPGDTGPGTVPNEDTAPGEDTVTTGVAVPAGVAPPAAPPGQDGPVWRFLISRKWLLWHVTAAAGVWGMAWLGDWQYHRAVGGNGLSWAYTFEWPMFACFGIVFWARTVRDEFRIRRAGLDPNLERAGVEVGIQLPAGLGLEQAGAYVGGAPAAAQWTGEDGAEPVLASAWRADVMRAAADFPADPEVAEYNIYLAKLRAKDEARERANLKQ